MLPKKHRLSLSKSAQVANSKESLIQGEYFALRIVRQKIISTPRFAIIVSGRIAKKATQRNRIKRLLVEALRPLLNLTKDGFDVVLLPRRKAALANLSQLQDSAKQTFQKANLLKKSELNTF